MPPKQNQDDGQQEGLPSLLDAVFGPGVGQEILSEFGAAGADDDYEAQPGSTILGSSPGFTPGRFDWELGTGPVNPNPSKAIYREEDVNNILTRLQPFDLHDLQMAMAEAGILSGYLPEWPDDRTEKAFRQVLGLSNRTGRPWQQTVSMLQQRATQAELERQRREQAMRPRLTTTVSNPEALRQQFKDAVIAQTGEDRGQVDYDKMVGAYQNLERRYQQQSWNAQVRGGGGEIVAPPTAAEFAEQQIRNADPTGVEARDAVDYAGELFNMLGGPFEGGGY